MLGYSFPSSSKNARNCRHMSAWVRPATQPTLMWRPLKSKLTLPIHAERKSCLRTLKNNTVGGNFTVSNVTPEWLGVLFSNIGGNLNLSNITATDPEDDGNAAVSVVVNTIGKNLNCQNLGPRLTGGAIPGEFNIVGHKTTGQCVGLLSGF